MPDTLPNSLIWVALPNGLSGDPANPALHLSLLLSPRLATPDPSGPPTLENSAFALFRDWPVFAATLAFDVEFIAAGRADPFAILPATLDTSALDSATWQALFPGTLAVTPHAPEGSNFANRDFNSFQVRQTFQNIVQGYRPDPDSLPEAPTSAAALRQATRHRLAALVPPTAAERQRVRARLNRLRAKHGAVTAHHIAGIRSVSREALHFDQMQGFFQGLSDGAGRRYAAAKANNFALAPPTFDFHAAITAVARYPLLMRRLGLVLDLVVGFPDSAAFAAALAALPAGSSIDVRLRTPLPAGWQSATPRTLFQMDTALGIFCSYSGSGVLGIANGMLAPRDDTPMALDLDRLAHGVHAALVQFHAEAAAGGAPVLTLPAPRSGGLSLARGALAASLQQMLNRQGEIDAGLSDGSGTSVTLGAEDLLRGLRVDIRTAGDPTWRSLHGRFGDYRLRNSPVAFRGPDEGFITLRTFNPDTDAAATLYSHENLFRWTGWSLSVPRPGKAIAPDGGLVDATGIAVDADGNPLGPPDQNASNLALTVKFDLVPNARLPRLRFGNTYACRLRMVDLAGNSVEPLGDTLDDFTFALGKYLRFDPVIAPTLVMKTPPAPGESVDRLVISGDIDGPTGMTAERLVAPPKTSVQMAEWHGMFDTPTGVDPGAFATIVTLDGDFAETPYGDNVPSLPYLPDPLARGASLDPATPPGQPPGESIRVSFDGQWPNLAPFRLILREGSDSPSWDAAQRALTLSLPKGRTATFNLGSFFDAGTLGATPEDDAVEDLALFDYWNAIESSLKLRQRRQLLWDEAAAGRNEQLTPHRVLTLVHASQRPVLAPQIDPSGITPERDSGDTFCRLRAHVTLDGPSTDRLELMATWDEPVDDGMAAPSRVTSSARAWRRDVEPDENDWFMAAELGSLHPSVKHEFHDTKYRRVTYQVVATTRFREYFPEAITANVANLTQVSDPITVDVPSSAPPAAPKVLYVVPTFGWDAAATTDGAVRSRRVGLRVYFDRPWYSSGDGERVGVVIPIKPLPPPPSPPGGDGGGEGPPPGPRPGIGMAQPVPEPPAQIVDGVAPFVTQWGTDPAFLAGTVASPFAPLPQQFTNARSVEFYVRFQELVGNFGISEFALATFDVMFDPPNPADPGARANPNKDPHNGRWFCDIEIDPGEAYFPFLRLALVRFQPNGIAQSELVAADVRASAIVVADFAQLAPGRTASVVFDSSDPARAQIALTGPGYAGNEALGDKTRLPPYLRVAAQMDIGEPGAPVWITTGESTAEPDNPGVGGAMTWRATVTLPFARGSRPMRVTLREYQRLPTDADFPRDLGAPPGIASRLIYADAFPI